MLSGKYAQLTKIHFRPKRTKKIQRDISEAMEERTTTVVRIIPAIKKDPLRSLLKTWAGVDSNHRTLSGTDLQSVAFSHSATYPYLIFINLPLTRFELVASPLPRECATPAPQGHAFA